MSKDMFKEFFSGSSKDFLISSIDLALEEDGEDLTSRGLFNYGEKLKARVICKQEIILAGLPLIDLILSRINGNTVDCELHIFQAEGDKIAPNTVLASLKGPALTILKSERIILTFVSHLSGIATLTHKFLQELQGSRTKILDTRKTLPGLRYPEKYAVKVGGGANHRFNLQDMVILKDNHIDRAGSISRAVKQIRDKYLPVPPLEVECRSEAEVEEAIACKVDRIMLDNMEPDAIKGFIKKIPSGIETEISGGISLQNIREFSQLGADYISIGYLTHSAKSVDLSMQLL